MYNERDVFLSWAGGYNDADDGNRTTGVSLVVVKLALRAIEFWREADTSHSLGI